MADSITAWFIAAVVMTAMSLFGSTASAIDTGVNQPLFAKDSPLEMELSANFANICHDPTSGHCKVLPATISYQDDSGSSVQMDVKLRTRGRWRKETGDCNMPALFVYLDSAQTEGTLFENQTMLPFTTHCKPYDRKYQHYTMLEYLAYRYYGLLTDASLKVRLTHTTFQDTGGGKRVRRFGFFSEHFQNASARLGAEHYTVEALDPRDADAMEMATLSLFQYMIGNLDWSVVASHNIALFRHEQGRVIPLPFDFDFSGIVNSEYATPPAAMHLYNIRVRKYRGFCWPGFDWEALFHRFLVKRNEIMGLVETLPAVDTASLVATRRYLKDFFATIESKRKRKREIIDKCRDLPPASSN